MSPIPGPTPWPDYTAQRCNAPDPRPGHTRSCFAVKGHSGQHQIRDAQDNIVFSFDPAPPPDPIAPLLEEARAMLLQANNDPGYSATCTNCHTKVFFVAAPYALIKGHIFSEAGMAEFRRNTGWCEYCFDEFCLSMDPENEENIQLGPGA